MFYVVFRMIKRMKNLAIQHYIPVLHTNPIMQEVHQKMAINIVRCIVQMHMVDMVDLLAIILFQQLKE